MDLGLKGRKALVTGGTKGIGRSVADLLADEGSDVALCARGFGSLLGHMRDYGMKILS